jgi:hypothetical protein
MTPPDSNYALVRFVEQLHDVNCDWYGLITDKEERDRCKRWMDAVLPPPPPKETMDVPFLEEEAAA